MPSLNTFSSSSTLLAVFLLVIIGVVFINACGYSENNIQDQELIDFAKPAPTNNIPDSLLTARRATASYNPIRITFSTLDLDDSSKYCTAAGETKPDFRGGTRTCVSEDIFTAAKKAELVNTLLPAAREMLSNAFSVVRLTSNLTVGSTSQCSGGFTIPQSHVDYGVEDTDLIIYVAAGPTASGNIAFAGGCQTDGASPNPRTIVGRMNFGPRYLSRSELPLDDGKRTVVHELLHAMQFASGSFTSAGITTTETIRGRSKTVINASTPVSKAREFFSCNSISGVELEDEGGSGTANSHVERRIYPEDIMAGSGGRALSPITLSIMESLQVYRANYSVAESMLTGKADGCDFVTSSTYCSSENRLNGFCPTKDTTDVSCTADLRGYGPCSEPFLSDSCNIYRPFGNKVCYDTSQSDSSDTGDNFHADSRCFNVSQNNFRKQGSNLLPSNNKRCFRVRCASNGLSLEFTLDRSGSGTWYNCSKIGEPIYVSGFENSLVICPNITDYCTSVLQFVNRAPSDSAEVYDGTIGPAPGSNNAADEDWLAEFFSQKEVIIGFSCGAAGLILLCVGMHFYCKSKNKDAAAAAGDGGHVDEHGRARRATNADNDNVIQSISNLRANPLGPPRGYNNNNTASSNASKYPV